MTLPVVNLAEVYEVMLHTKYQGFRPSDFRQDVFPYLSLFKTCDPWAGPLLVPMPLMETYMYRVSQKNVDLFKLQ